jgi:16S rRNA (adenine1518-N6/adenine1519-N6)-dimethyltransferase
MRTLRSEPHDLAVGPAAILARAGVRPRKSRGQNFLVQPAIARRIVDAARLTADDSALEIGPGLGVLSAALLASPLRRLTLIELDSQLAAALTTRFADDRRVTMIAGDFLQVDFTVLPERPREFVVVSNLPFNVASAILERLCAIRRRIRRMVLMFQREVGERIRAQPGSRAYGALSAYTALYWRVTEHFRVAAGSFHPRPKVDAEVLIFEPLATPLFEEREESAVLATIRASFSAPRKTMRNSLADGLGVAPALTETMLRAAEIDPALRPGALGVAKFVRLARVICQKDLSADPANA